MVAQGWLASLCQSLGLGGPFALRPARHLLAHVFFNLPMASRLLLQALENIPGEQRQLAAQLGPWLALLVSSNGRGYGDDPTSCCLSALHTCSVSPGFATVLSLGGGPAGDHYRTWLFIGRFGCDYDPTRAAMLALIQMVCCLGLVLLISQVEVRPFARHHAAARLARPGRSSA